jgi:hypothetical protein
MFGLTFLSVNATANAATGAANAVGSAGTSFTNVG